MYDRKEREREREREKERERENTDIYFFLYILSLICHISLSILGVDEKSKTVGSKMVFLWSVSN